MLHIKDITCYRDKKKNKKKNKKKIQKAFFFTFEETFFFTKPKDSFLLKAFI